MCLSRLNLGVRAGPTRPAEPAGQAGRVGPAADPSKALFTENVGQRAGQGRVDPTQPNPQPFLMDPTQPVSEKVDPLPALSTACYLAFWLGLAGFLYRLP